MPDFTWTAPYTGTVFVEGWGAGGFGFGGGDQTDYGAGGGGGAYAAGTISVISGNVYAVRVGSYLANSFSSFATGTFPTGILAHNATTHGGSGTPGLGGRAVDSSGSITWDAGDGAPGQNGVAGPGGGGGSSAGHGGPGVSGGHPTGGVGAADTGAGADGTAQNDPVNGNPGFGPGGGGGGLGSQIGFPAITPGQGADGGIRIWTSYLATVLAVFGNTPPVPPNPKTTKRSFIM